MVVTISNETDWNNTFINGQTYTNETYKIDTSFTFGAAPNIPILGLNAELNGYGYVLTIGSFVHSGFVKMSDASAYVHDMVVVNGSGSIGTDAGSIIAVSSTAGTIENSYFWGDLSNEGSGGIVGASCSNLNISTCYFNGEINGTKSGGILGQVSTDCVIDQCYSKGYGLTGIQCGGIVGYDADTAVVTNCYYLGNYRGGTECGGMFSPSTNAGNTVAYSYVQGVFNGTNGAIQSVTVRIPAELLASVTGIFLYSASGNTYGANTTVPAQVENVQAYYGSNSVPTGWDTNVWQITSNNDYMRLKPFENLPFDADSYTESNDNAIIVEGNCILEGSLILTPSGQKLIETLKVGDEIITGDGKTIKIANMNGYQSKHVQRHPVKIPKDHFKKDVPFADTYLSLPHAIRFEGKWVHASCIPKRKICHDFEIVKYHHIYVENYLEHTIVVNGMEVEPWDGFKVFDETTKNYYWKCSKGHCERFLREGTDE
jgi:hypothetical protein